MTIPVETFIETMVRPAYTLLPPRMRSVEATAMMYAIGLQESRFKYRFQIGGPARSFYQFEENGGVAGIMDHAATEGPLRDVTRALMFPWSQTELHKAMAYNDVLATAMCRLLVWTHPDALPDLDSDPDISWQYYIWTWRPGTPHPDTWDRFWQQATTEVYSV